MADEGDEIPDDVPLHLLLRRVNVVIPAWNEAASIGETVRVAAELPGVRAVFVVDDGSTDGTADAASDAGAHVVRHERNLGKGRAMETGANEAARFFANQCGTDHQELLLFLDADLREAASQASLLIEPIRAEEADLCVATFAHDVAVSGLSLRAARAGIRRATGEHLRPPIPGLLCIRRSAFLRAHPVPRGYGVEAAITIDVLRAGFRVREVHLNGEHRGARRRARRGGLHGIRKAGDVARALWPRLLQGDH